MRKTDYKMLLCAALGVISALWCITRMIMARQEGIFLEIVPFWVFKVLAAVLLMEMVAHIVATKGHELPGLWQWVLAVAGLLVAVLIMFVSNVLWHKLEFLQAFPGSDAPLMAFVRDDLFAGNLLMDCKYPLMFGIGIALFWSEQAMTQTYNEIYRKACADLAALEQKEDSYEDE